MRNNKSLNWAAGIVAVLAGGWLAYFLLPSPPPIDPRPHLGVGEVLAAEAMRLGDSGSRVIAIVRDMVEFKVPAARAQLEGFQTALKAAGRAPAVLRVMKDDPLRVVAVQPGEFLEMLRQAKETDVFVSFLGPPVLAEEQARKLGPKRPKIVALCSGAMPGRVDLAKLFGQQLLHAAVVSKPDAPAGCAPADNNRKAFDSMFKIITPQNLAELSAAAAKD